MTYVTTHNDILRHPDYVAIVSDGTTQVLESNGNGSFGGHRAEVTLHISSNGSRVDLLASKIPVERIHLRWHGQFASGTRLLGDHWERGYGDLEWRGIVPERVMPWYFLAYDGRCTHGYGVKTGASSVCYWRADSSGISLFLDVRSGGLGVMLGDRVLEAAVIVSRVGNGEETPFEAARAFCALMCDRPRLPDHQIYGANNWYYAYGNSSHEAIVRDTEVLLSHCSDNTNRPYMVIDSGWEPNVMSNIPPDRPYSGEMWDRGNDRFPDMPGLASTIRSMGARPGIWIRPLPVGGDVDSSMRLSDSRMQDVQCAIPVIDPSIPENLARVKADISRLVDWGFELVKHDFTNYDLFGLWGFEIGSSLAKPGWSFADRSRTTAEIVCGLYSTIREGARNAVIVGCNTMGHLAAGLFEIQRTGDDTSGQEWERTRKMGINTMAFRMAQHETLFYADADVVGITGLVPWELNSQWLDLLARSGTPLFVSASPDAIGEKQSAALRKAFARAANPQQWGIALDWMDTTCPRVWEFSGETVVYNWHGADGVDA